MIIKVEESSLDGNVYLKEVDTEKYYFDDLGNEYWYDKSGKIHYTKNEG